MVNSELDYALKEIYFLFFALFTLLNVYNVSVARFGARLRGRRTGIIWNNEMDDFSAPNITNEFGLLPSEANFIEGGKRPLSSMCPAVVVRSGGGDGHSDDGDRDSHIKLIVGAAGGSLITSTTAWVSLEIFCRQPKSVQQIKNCHEVSLLVTHSKHRNFWGEHLSTEKWEPISLFKDEIHSSTK